MSAFYMNVVGYKESTRDSVYIQHHKFYMNVVGYKESRNSSTFSRMITVLYERSGI